MRYRSLVMVFICMLSLTVANIAYTYVASQKAADETGRKFCSVIVPVVQAYHSEEPKTELGKLLKERYIRLEEELRCDG